MHASFARWIGRAGNPAEARDHFAALLPAFKRVFGPYHPDTLSVQEIISDLTARLGIRHG